MVSGESEQQHCNRRRLTTTRINVSQKRKRVKKKTQEIANLTPIKNASDTTKPLYFLACLSMCLLYDSSKIVGRTRA